MEKFNLIFLPDSNYSDIIIDKFEQVAEGKNVYICLANEIKYIKSKKVNFIHSSLSGRFHGNLSFLNKVYGRIFFNLNSLITTNFYYKYIHQKSNFKDAKLIMMFWSGELYNHPAYEESIYDNHSLKYRKNNKLFFSSKAVDFGLRLLKMPSYSAYYKLNQSMDYFCCFFQSEHEIFNRTFQSKSKFVLFTFLDLELLKLQESDFESKKEDILIGNSGSLENNHAEAFNLLKKLNSEDYRKIIVPLSYGDNNYIQSIISLGSQYFGERMNAMSEFLDRNQYNNSISNVKVAVFNHYIQQAVGNILYMLYIGARIYFNENNPLYKGFLDKGFIVNSLSDLEIIKLKPMDPLDRKHNKNLILELLNVNASLNYYKTIAEL
ncbi:TDP-N-acetylfucosamine:lipid II N-acetylfucosaminyltransferase [Chryseobacterium camelliae]|uniref:TDP-N-acetylfucosamine:lipid II N-acetylfucosaminyltransferase n=1 Tax=Chryseobacterium camelliae TaxID=1265445 RepID=UPI000C1CBD41|nr:TDP-N-acetylfucosamine:lipid II N-acetylfucosaminyltransferase [Chryseobacterium camelliae]